MSTLGKNIASNIIGQTLVLFSSTIAARFIFRDLGVDALGLIYFVLTLNAVLCGSLEMGISFTVIREIAAHHDEDPAHVTELLRTASLIYWAGYLILAVGIYASAPWFVMHWIHLSTMSPHDATPLIRMLGISAVSGLPRSLYVSIFRGLQRMELNNGIDVVSVTVQQLGVIALLYFRQELMTVIAWLSLTLVLWLVLYATVLSYILSWHSLVPGYSPSVIRRTRSFAFNMASVSLLSMAHVQADKAIVSKLIAIADLGYYGIASQFASRAARLSGSIAQAALPSFSAAIKQSDHAIALRSYTRIQNLTCILMLPVFAGLVSAWTPLCTFLFNHEVSSRLLLPMIWLCVGQYMNATVSTPYVYSLAKGRPDIARRQNVVALFVSSPLAVWLTLRYGLAGAGFSWVVYHLVAYVYGVPQFCRDCMEIPVLAWYWHILKIDGAAVVTYGAGWLLLSSVGFTSIALVCVAYCVSTVAFLAMGYRLLDDELRGLVLLIIKRIYVRPRTVAVE